MLETEIARKYSGLNVPLTERFHLTADVRQFIVLERHIVDPTKAPKFDSATMSGELREDWREATFYPLNSKGLAAALEYVVYRESAVGDGSDVSLSEFAESVRDMTADISDRLTLNFTGEIGVLMSK